MNINPSDDWKFTLLLAVIIEGAIICCLMIITDNAELMVELIKYLVGIVIGIIFGGLNKDPVTGKIYFFKKTGS